MSKHEPIAVPPEKSSSARPPSPELIERVRQVYLPFRAKNPGQRYPRKALNAIIRTSYGPLCAAAAIVEAELDAVETRLAAMPEMPEDLRLAQEQFLKELWVRTRELGATEAAAARRLAEEAEQRRAVETAEAHDLMGMLESERDDALQRAEGAEKALDEAREEVARLSSEMALAQARLEERDAILAMLSGATAPGAAKASRKAEGAKSRPAEGTKASEPSGPVTAILPGMGD